MAPRVRYLARGHGYTLFLTDEEAVLTLHRGGENATPTSAAVVRMGLVGAAPARRISVGDQLPGRVNYFIGNDPAKWRTNVPTYSQVRYENVYPGIDLVYYGNQGQLEYDFVVAPGANPVAITLRFEGADRVELDPEGDLSLHLTGGKLRQRRPVVYQNIDGNRRLVEGGYVLMGKSQAAFRVGAYNPRHPLIIDPVLAYSTFLGGNGSDVGLALAVDAAGNAYVSGQVIATDFPTTPGAFDNTYNGGNTDTFVTKFNVAGTALVYSTYLGGNGFDFGHDLAVDAAGNTFLIGTTTSPNFPTTVGAFDPVFNGPQNDAFVTKVNPSGAALVYSTFLGGSGVDGGEDIVVDATGAAYVTGFTDSPTFPTTPGAYDTVVGHTDAFVTKLNAAGSALVFSTFLGGAGTTDFPHDLAVDGSGNVYVAGYAAATDFPASGFPTTPGAFDTTHNGGASDAFVTKINAAGTALIYSTFLGGTGDEPRLSGDLVVDAAGNAYMSGSTSSTNFPVTAGAFDTSFGGIEDAYVTKLNAAGSALVYSTLIGGSSLDNGLGIHIDAAGTAYITGLTASVDFPVTVGAFDVTPNGKEDAFLALISPSGSSLTYSTYFGGSGDDASYAIVVNAANGIYVTGLTESTNFPTTPGTFDTTLSVAYDAFVARFTVSGVETVGLYATSSSSFFLRNSNAAGPANVTFAFGPPASGWTPLSGDWDGNGTATPGLYNATTSTFFLKNTNAAGAADLVVTYGPAAGWTPIVGDWDGDGDDTVGLYNSTTSTFFLRNSNSAGSADLIFSYGPAVGWTPIVGDWDGDGDDTMGLYNPTTSTFFLKNSNAAGPADLMFSYGPAAGWTPVTGDWDGSGTHTVGLYNGLTSIFFLKNTNAAGPADLTFSYGPAGLGWMPLTGDWDGL